MNEVTTKVFESMLNFAKDTATFIAGEIPKVIQEYLTWNFMNNFLSALALFIVMILMVVIIVKSFKANQKNKDSAISIFGMIVPLCIFVLCAIPAFNYSLEAVKIKVAPRVYIIENVGNYMNNKGVCTTGCTK